MILETQPIGIYVRESWVDRCCALIEQCAPRFIRTGGCPESREHRPFGPKEHTIIRRMATKGYTQKEIAHRLNADQASISRTMRRLKIAPAYPKFIPALRTRTNLIDPTKARPVAPG